MNADVDVKQFAEEMMASMRGIIEGGQSAMPVAFALRASGRFDVIGVANMSGNAEKDATASLLHELVAAPGIACVVFLSDTYIKEGAGFPSSGSVKDIPGRREAIVAHVMAAGMADRFALWVYDRNAQGKPVFREIKWREEMDVRGRFPTGQKDGVAN